MTDRYECGDTLRALDVYVDGELDASTSLKVEQHLATCAECAAAAAVGRTLKRTVRLEARAELAPSSLRARFERSAEALRAAPPTSSRRADSVALVRGDAVPSSSRRPFRLSLSRALPLAAAATVAVAVGGGMRTLKQHGGGADASSSAHNVREKILDELAGNHARPLPPEEMDPLRVNKRFSPIVGVPVRPAALGLPPSSAWSFAGARLTTLSDDPTATLFYESSAGSRVTVFVYDPTRISVKAPCCLHPRILAKDGIQHTVLVGHARGYSVAVHEKNGVGHALSGDVDENELVTLALGM